MSETKRGVLETTPSNALSPPGLDLRLNTTCFVFFVPCICTLGWFELVVLHYLSHVLLCPIYLLGIRKVALLLVIL